MFQRRGRDDEVGVFAGMSTVTGDRPLIGGAVENGVGDLENQRIQAEDDCRG